VTKRPAITTWGNFLRHAVLPKAMRHWPLTTLGEKLIRIGVKVVCHDRKVVFQMAEVAVPRERFRDVRRSIERLRIAKAVSG
jgi:Transposase DDE domain group 1